MRYRAVLAGLLVALALIAPTPAGAQLSDRERQESKAQYERATRLYDLGKYAEAIESYQKAYEIGGDANMLYNIAQAYRLNDQPAEAARFYRRYLQRASNPRNRDDVEKKIAEMEKLAERRQASGAAVVPPPASGGTNPSHGGAATTPPTQGGAVSPPAGGTTPPPAGTGAITPLSGGSAPPSGGAPGTGLEPVSGGVPPSGPPPFVGGAVPGSVPPPVVDDPLRTKRKVAYALMGAGGGMLLVSMITGGAASSKASQLTKDSNNGEVYNPDLQSSGQALNIVAVTTFLLALGLGGAGGYLYYTVRAQEKAAATPATAAVLPVVGPGTVGAAGTFTF